MDFSIPDRVREIAGTIRSFLDREVVPLERQLFARGFGAVGPALRNGGGCAA